MTNRGSGACQQLVGSATDCMPAIGYVEGESCTFDFLEAFMSCLEVITFVDR